ncbi:MAG: hypothetical protein R2777_00530 [Chitinophagales bacterium]
MIKKYGQLFPFTIKHKWVAFAILLLSVGGIYYVVKLRLRAFTLMKTEKYCC